MLLFSRPTSTHGVKSFELSVKPGGLDTLVAFGPGSVLNGSVMLSLEKPVWAYNIRVVFKCEEEEDGRNKETSTIFQVESCIWGRPRSDGEKYQLFQGSHMYLFAIKMPNVNYPPSMHSTYVGHRIDYSLQAFLDLDTDLDAPYCIETACVPVVYLPLVTTASVPGEGAERRLTFRRSDSVVEATARLVKPAYCPGDPCTVKITTTNHSDNKISHVDVSLVCSITTSTGQEERKTRHQVLHTETFYVAIPKKTRDHHSVFRFDIPDQCVPTTQIHAERYLDIAYNVVISMGSNEVAMWPFSSSGNTALQNNTISLPVTLTTVPCNFPIPANLQLPLKTFSEQPELPCFIPNNDSPLPSPCSPYFSRSGSPIPDLDAMSADDNNVTLQDSSGFLMVPTSPRPDGSPRMSSDHTLRISPSRSTPAERSAALAVQ